MAVVRDITAPHGDQDRLSTHRSFFHQYAVTVLASALHTWSVGYKQGVAMVQPQVIFGSGDEVTPDVVWMSRQRLRDRGLDREGNLRQTPELVCEVLSPGTRNIWHDRHMKFQLYATSGVQEYWIVDLEAQRVDVSRRQTDEWSPHVGELAMVDHIDHEHTLTTPLLPLFSLKARELFPTLIPRA